MHMPKIFKAISLGHLVILAGVAAFERRLDDGQGLKPHMGWSSWVRIFIHFYLRARPFLTWEDLRMLLNVMLHRSDMPLTRPTSSSSWASRILDTNISTLTTAGLPRTEMSQATSFRTPKNGLMVFAPCPTRFTA